MKILALTALAVAAGLVLAWWALGLLVPFLYLTGVPA